MRKERDETRRSGSGSRRPRWTAFTLIEVVISTLIVSLMLVAGLQAVGAVRAAGQWVDGRGCGMLLAQDLLAEILQQAYADPAWGLGTLGPGADETVTGNRSLYDDVDDYNGWQASPPQYKDGTPIAWATGYERAVAVTWVNPNNPNQVVGSESNVKRITVTVRRNGKEVAQLVALRTTAWVAPQTIVEGGGP